MGVQIVKLLDSLNPTIVTGGLVPKGAYNAGTDYAVGDSVDYNGSSYVMYADAGAGTLPTNTTYWQVLASKGSTGATGATGSTGATGAAGADGVVQSIVAGSNVTVDNTDPANPIVSSTGGSSDWTADSPGILYAGHIAIGADADVDGTGPTNSLLQDAIGIGTNKNVLGIQETMTGSPATWNNGIEIKVNSNFSSAPTTLVAIEALAATSSGNNKGATILAGFYGGSAHRGTGTVTTAYGLPTNVVNASSGTITTASLFAGGVTNSGSGTITTANGITIDAVTNSGGGTVTTAYGINVQPQTVGSTAYGIAIGAATTNTLWISSNANNSTESAGIVFGISKDTNLYRSAANTLKTDDKFWTASELEIDGALNHDGSTAGFFNTTPASQPTGDIKTALDTLGLTATTSYVSEHRFLITNAI